MKLKSLFVLAIATLLTLASPRTARAADVSFDFFYNSLSPYGEWIEVGDYGTCWRPSGVDEDWAPYSDGYWAYTDAGWTWVSYEDFGGIVYHYGRWAKVEDEGWVWVPDYEWGPAWVSWRRNDDYVGWAPLPAEAQFRRERGFSVWVDNSYDIGPSHYNFCHLHDFGAPVLRPLIVRRTENYVIIGDTVNITNISYNDRAGCAFNGGLDYGFVNRYARRPIPALKLVRNNNITIVNNNIVNNNVRVTNYNAVQRGNQLTVISPNVVRPQAAQLATLVKPKRVIPQSKVTKGWTIVPQEQQATLKAKFAQEAQGQTPENAPARAVKPADLKVVPVKADPKAKLPQTQPVAVTKGRGGEDQPTPAEATATGNPLPPAAIAGKPGKKPGKGLPATPVPQVTDNPPATTNAAIPATPVVPERPVKGRPGVTKPFNPVAADPQTPTAPTAPTTSEPTPAQTAAEARRNAAAAKQAAAQQKREEALQQRQEIVRQRMNDTPADAPAAAPQKPNNNNAARQNEAAAARQRMVEQQQNQQEAIAQKQQAAQQQQQQLRQNQEAVSERAQQQSASRERSQQAQQQQQAQAAAARREAIERNQVQRPQMPPQPVRPNPQQQQQIQQNRPAPQQPAAQSKKPPQGGKHPLTPEEAAKQAQ